MKPVTIVLMTAVVTIVAGCTTSKVSTSYYTISGETAPQLDREIRRKGPMKGHALAVAAISFVPVSVTQEESKAGCRFKSARFRVEADITLPRWQQRTQSSDRDLKRAWDGLSRYARAHENQHVIIAEQFAGKMSEDLLAIPAQKSCKSLDRQAKKIVDRIGKQHNEAQNFFDAEEARRLKRLMAEAG